MTDAEIAAIEARANAAVQRIVSGHSPMRIPVDPTDPDLVLSHDLPALVAEVRRLRGLVVGVEKIQEAHSGDVICVFCGEIADIAPGDDFDRPIASSRHTTDCPAFTAPGVVR